MAGGFSWGGAAGGLNQTLEQMLAERRAAFLLRQQAEQQQAAAARQGRQMDLQERQFGLDERQFADRQQRQSADDAAATEEAQSFEALVQGLPEHVRPIVQLRKRGVPLDQHALETPEQHSAHVATEQQAEDARELRMTGEKAKIAAQYRDPKTRETQWVIRNGQPLEIPKGTSQPGDRPFNANQAATGGPNAGALYTAERAQRVTDAVDNLLPQVNAMTVGWGGLLANIPATEARKFRAQLDTLKSNIAFGELTEMREASKTGGALGQVSNVELGLLENSLGALDTLQDAESIRDELLKVKASIQRWNAAKQRAAGEQAAPSPDAPAAAPRRRRYNPQTRQLED